MLLAFGIACALVEAKSSGEGQVVDAAMVDGSALLMTMFHGLKAMGIWDGPAGHQPARHRRATSTTSTRRADGEYVVARVDRAAVLRRAAPPHRHGPTSHHQMDRGAWPEMQR